MEIKVQLGPIWTGSAEERDARLMQAVAQVLVEEHLSEDGVSSKVASLVNGMLTDQVREGVRMAVAAVVDRALDDEFTPQDGYGVKSVATSIRREIQREVGQAAAALSGSRRDNYDRQKSQQFWEKLVGGHVKEIVKEEVGGVVAEIKAGAENAVRIALAAEIGVNLKVNGD